MKFFFLLPLFICAKLHAQIDQLVQYDYRITYDYTFQPDKQDSTIVVTEGMILEAGPLYSNFCSYKLFQRDSVIYAMDELMKKSPSPPMMPRMPRPQIQYKIFKEHPERQMHYAAAFGVKRASYHETLPVFNWQLEEGEDSIAGYACKKATTSFAGRDYIAWYTPDIDIADGPYKFYGLPGLILAIYDNRQQHKFTVTSIEKKPRVATLAKWKGMYMQNFPTKEAFTAYADKLKENPALMYEQDLIKVSQEMTDRIVENTKNAIARFTNPLELP